MGANMARRLTAGGHRVVTYDVNPEAVAASTQHGAEGAASLEELVRLLPSPRAVWMMLPIGQPTEDTIASVTPLLSPGDILIDGGNANYKDSMRRALEMSELGIEFIDVGISGGIWGLVHGFCLMVGGPGAAVRRMEPAFRTLTPSEDVGYCHFGPSGAGHYVKMVHNGVEYALMQSYAEGFELLEAKEEFSLDLAQVISIWRHGSVVRSWLLDLAERALKEDPGLDTVQSYVEDSGEGRWTVNESIDLGVPAPVIALSLQARFRSRQVRPFGGRMLAALRNQFGGHRARASGCEEK
jgi:6-phosphogluconate dehydrogenase